VQDQARSQVGTQLGSLLSYEGQGRGRGDPEVNKLLFTAATFTTVYEASYSQAWRQKVEQDSKNMSCLSSPVHVARRM